MREPARRYLDMVGECLDLGPESRHEVMSELDNHFIEEVAVGDDAQEPRPYFTTGPQIAQLSP